MPPAWFHRQGAYPFVGKIPRLIMFANPAMSSCKQREFRACGRDQRAFRSPFESLRPRTCHCFCRLRNRKFPDSSLIIKKQFFFSSLKPPLAGVRRQVAYPFVGKIFCLIFFASHTIPSCRHRRFRACGRVQGAFRSPPGLLRPHTC